MVNYNRIEILSKKGELIRQSIENLYKVAGKNEDSQIKIVSSELDKIISDLENEEKLIIAEIQECLN